MPPALMQPVAAEDVAAALAEIAVAAPVNGIIELGGPEALPVDEISRRYLKANGDGREVVTDSAARYFGAEINDHSLTPGDNPRIGSTRLEDWLSTSMPRK
jgi:uncharacterized protein YbjT (DUF2867 family)